MIAWSSQEPGLVAWCPISGESRLFAKASLVNNEPAVYLMRLNFEKNSPTADVVSKIILESPVTAIDWAPHHTEELGLIAVGQENGVVSLLSPSKQTIISNIGKNGSKIVDVVFNPSQTIDYIYILIVNEASNVTLFNIAKPQSPELINNGISRPSGGNYTRSTWHPKWNARHIAALCDTNGHATTWSVGNSTPIHLLAGTDIPSLSDIEFSQHQDYLLATASKSAAFIWDIRKPNGPMHRLTGHTNGVTSVTWSPVDERILFTAGNDGKVIAWNAETGKPLSSVQEVSEHINDIRCSPFIKGLLLASTSSSVVLISFADPSIGAQNPIRNIRYHLKPSGVNVAFDGRVFSYSGKKVNSCVHHESIPESTAFGEFVQALEKHDVKGFVNTKLEAAATPTEKEAWDVISMAMDPDNFKDSILKKIGIEKTAIAKEIADKAEVITQNVTDDANVSSLFGSAPSAFGEASSIFGSVAQSEDTLFSRVYAPFRVLPKEESDAKGRIIAQAVIAGDLPSAIDAAFQSESYADALLIASCGPAELFEKTRQRYITKIKTPLSRIFGYVIDKDLDSFVRYAKVKDWREIFAVICNFGGESFEELSRVLGRRLIVEKSDYSSALICFVAARDYEMVQQCLFRVYETIDKMDPSSTSVILLVLEKITVIAGDKAGEVVAPLVQTFLQHILQSGQKENALRFLDALPRSKVLSDLRAAIAGDVRPAAPAKQQPQQIGARPGVPSNVYNPVAATAQASQIPASQIPAPTPNQTPNVFVPAKVAMAPPTFQQQGNTPYMPTNVVPPPPPQANFQKDEPSAVPEPNSNNPRQMGRNSYNQNVPPPPKLGEINATVPQFPSSNQNSSLGGMAAPTYYNPAASNLNQPPYGQQTGSNSGFQPFTPGFSTPSYNQPQTIAPPPPVSKGNVAPPPPMPPVQPPSAPAYGQVAPPPTAASMYGQQTGSNSGFQTFVPQGFSNPSYNQTQSVAPPPPALKPTKIQAPPPPPQIQQPQQTAAPVYGQPTTMAPPPAYGAMPNFIQPPKQQPVVQQPAQELDTATLEDVPEEYQEIAQALNQLVKELTARPEASPGSQRAAADAEAKLPKSFAEFCHGHFPEELKENIETFLKEIFKGNLEEALDARRKCVTMLSRCHRQSNTIRLIINIANALKAN